MLIKATEVLVVTIAYQPWQNFVSFNWYNSCSKEGFAQDRRLHQKI